MHLKRFNRNTNQIKFYLRCPNFAKTICRNSTVLHYPLPLDFQMRKMQRRGAFSAWRQGWSLEKGRTLRRRPYLLFQETCFYVAQLVKLWFLIVQDKGISCKLKQRVGENPNLWQSACSRRPRQTSATTKSLNKTSLPAVPFSSVLANNLQRKTCVPPPGVVVGSRMKMEGARGGKKTWHLLMCTIVSTEWLICVRLLILTKIGLHIAQNRAGLAPGWGHLAVQSAPGSTRQTCC